MAKLIEHKDVFKVDPGAKVDMHQTKYPDPCPAAASLKDAINTAFGAGQIVMQHYKWWSELNRHDAGLAIDIFLNALVPAKKLLAFHLIELLLNNQPQLKWFDIIYEHKGFHKAARLSTSAERAAAGCSSRDNKADDHLDHLHIDWYDESTTVFDPAIRSYHATVLDRGTQKWVDDRLVAIQRPDKGFVKSITWPADAEQRQADDPAFQTALASVAAAYQGKTLTPMTWDDLVLVCTGG